MSRLEGKETSHPVTKGRITPLHGEEKADRQFGPLRTVSFDQVQISDRLWKQRLETSRTVTIPTCLETSRDNRIQNFARAGRPEKGAFTGLAYDDSDLYKVIEGAAYCLHDQPDPELERDLDVIIDLIASAQWDDGYLFTFYTLPQPRPALRWTDLEHRHELYCAGHLVEAAIAYHEATGKRKLLDVAIRLIDHIDARFGPTEKRGTSGHPEIEIALVKLSQATGNTRYLELASFFLNERGCTQRDTYGTYAQDHKPVIDQDEAVGHAVRALYLYAGMADVAAATGQPDYRATLRTLWQDVVSRKLYLIGGVGSRHEIEGFGPPYELPNEKAYCETCAAIALIMYSHRMFLFEKDAGYYDVLERSLYNNVLAGVSMTGDTFFYHNVLACDGQLDTDCGQVTRQPWYECACCPSNVARFIPTVPGYIYAQEDNTVYVNLFIASRTTFEMSGKGCLTLSQTSNYPWDGNIHVTVDTNTPTPCIVKLRIPGWARNRPVPSDLYRYLDQDHGQIELKVNGQAQALTLEKGYAILGRTWNTGDSIDLHLPMQIRRVLSHDLLKENQGRMALERGPVVYCAEGIDNTTAVERLILPDEAELSAEYRKDLLNGVNVIRSPQDLTLVPYYAWGHRGPGEMAVWLRRG